jgi:SAM-dependent methyltransferase
MLNRAQAKASDAKSDILFLQQDIDGFELYGTAGAIVSTLDSLNYLIGRGQLRRVFQLVQTYLDPGGLFVFDVNTRYRLSRVLGENLYYDISDEICYLWENSYDAAARVTTFDLTFFVKNADGAYRRFDERHRQRAYSDREIRGAAAKAPGLRLAGAYAHLTFERPGAATEKVCYVFCKESFSAIRRA